MVPSGWIPVLGCDESRFIELSGPRAQRSNRQKKDTSYRQQSLSALLVQTGKNAGESELRSGPQSGQPRAQGEGGLRPGNVSVRASTCITQVSGVKAIRTYAGWWVGPNPERRTCCVHTKMPCTRRRVSFWSMR